MAQVEARFEQYRQASGLMEKDEQRQVSTLLYCLGEEAEEVLNTTRISDKNRKKYQKVIEQFDAYFKVRKNVIYECARFNKRSQLLDESVDHFITEIHMLAETCEFGDMKEELIRDRLIVGIQDLALSERLQLEPDLDLDKPKRLIRQREAVKLQQEFLQKPPRKEDISLDAVRQPTPRRKLPAIPVMPKPPSSGCQRCGRGAHPQQLCPAKDAICRRCNRRGHYSSQCMSSTVALVSTAAPEQGLTEQLDEEYTETAYLDTIEGIKGNIWEVQIAISDKIVIFKVDTGAEVTVLSDTTWKILNLSEPLQNLKTSLCGPDSAALKVLGKAVLTLTHNGRQCTQPVFIVKNIKNNLLGLPAIKALDLLSCVDSVNDNIISQYPSLFTGLGTFAHEYKIQLKPNSQPFALCTPRNIPLALRPKVKAEIQHMENLGVISRVNEPTP